VIIDIRENVKHYLLTYLLIILKRNSRFGWHTERRVDSYVTVTEALVLRLLLEDRGRITELIRILLCGAPATDRRSSLNIFIYRLW